MTASNVKLCALAALVALHGVAAPTPQPAQAGEVHFEQTHYRDVTLAPWAPSVSITGASTFTNAGGTVTGTIYYALQPEGSIGTGPVGPVSGVVVGATASAVRLSWERVGGATNMLIWRGVATNTVTNWISVGAVTSAWDYGTNGWAGGTPSVTATAVPTVRLTGDDPDPNAVARRGWVLEQIAGNTNSPATIGFVTSLVESNTAFPRLQGNSYLDAWASGVESILYPRTVAASVTTQETEELIIRVSDFGSSFLDQSFFPVALSSATNAELSWSISPTNLASIDSNGFMTAIASGTATVRMDVGRFWLGVPVDVNASYEGTVYTILTGQTGTWRRIITDTFESLIANPYPYLFSSMSHAATSYVYASTSTMAGVDLGALAVWNSREGDRKRAGTLITPRHTIHVSHYALQAGDTIRFAPTSGAVLTRTVLAVSNFYPDLSIALLDSAIPTNSIQPAMIMDNPLTGQFLSYNNNETHRALELPAWTINQDCRIISLAWYVNGWFGKSSLPEYTNGFFNVRSGDSGSAVYLVASNRPVLFGPVQTTGPGTPGLLWSYTSQLASAITALCPTCNYSMTMYRDFTNYYSSAPPPL